MIIDGEMETTDRGAWTPDESQQRVIEASGGYHLVLAPPGCGKTQILTERIKVAHGLGVAYDSMLCLTFTNRAARGMRERIGRYIADDDVCDLYVGNVHRFCSKFLYENHLVPSEGSVIDDDDGLSILARYLNEEEDEVRNNNDRRRGYGEVIQFSHFMHQIAHGHPRQLRLHPSCLSSDDITALKYICRVERRPFTAEMMVDVYEHNDYYADATVSEAYDTGVQQLIRRLLRKMKYAHAYTAYCRQNHLLDFEDLLLLTYDALREADVAYKRYQWVQVDEVQDLNAMQLAIVDSVTDREAVANGGVSTVMYLGDGQQAIFSFMGAKTETLDMLRSRCQGRVHYLHVNHRSPSFLLRVFNDYAQYVLNMDPQLLPQPREETAREEGELRILTSETLDGEYDDVARFAISLHESHPDDTVAIIVNANRDADRISRCLTAANMPHFKVSGADVFASEEMKVLLAHLNVLANETNFMAWARLVRGVGVYQTAPAARGFVRKLLQRAILPSDAIVYGRSTYVLEFADVVGSREVVVFDTETTGLDVAQDDILQIAAVKMRGGKVVDGSEFCVHIATNRPIPEMLGDIPNPIIEERRHQELIPPREALQMFMQYVADDVLVGHNVEYDYHILDHNLRRYLPEVSLSERGNRRFDTLKLLRLFHPDLLSHRLDDLRRQHLFGLREDNAHLADVDVADTCLLVAHLYAKCLEVIPGQVEFLAKDDVQHRLELLRRNYGPLYLQARQQLYARDAADPEPAMVATLRGLYTALYGDAPTANEHKLEYVFRYLAADVVDVSAAPSLQQQLQRYLMEVNTLKEADLCGSSVIADRVFVSTVHKAKGLEFDNVIVFDAVDGRYPNYLNHGNAILDDEDKRKFYVALSRARRRLYVSWNMTRIDYRKEPHPRELTPFMKPLLRYFDSGSGR